MAEKLCVKMGGGGGAKSISGTFTLPADSSYTFTLSGWNGINAIRYFMTSTPANGYTGININTADLWQQYSTVGYIPTVQGNSVTIPRLSAGAVNLTYYFAGY